MKVYFVGAGPGDPELITVRGRRLLEEADVVIYADSLIHPGILGYVREGAEIHGSSSMRLQELVDLMAEACAAGKMVVRLVSGDPSLYSAVNEQTSLLERKGISSEIVPGVSSFSAAAASLGVELTCPEVSQAVVLARAEGRTPLPEGARLADVLHPSATAAVFLSAGLGEELLREFLAAGFPERTPAAAVYRASWESERRLETRLELLPERLAREGMHHQTLILVGEVLGRERREGKRSRLYRG
ncbi:precorrin-4 C(11)-methyltransferase [Candidatus Solincola tengchongensis]|uniref:precorrin-4 C(11)-methyltransferase n=1 Tax=Candidatus Solincola tengchongensis TaxID=2900693 RepID=UPI00257ACF7E|nr:precorrin-4 C(11)-methyltransferase [Candidatus Solincola tengchongensis]